jgi:hypothetical protein
MAEQDLLNAGACLFAAHQQRSGKFQFVFGLVDAGSIFLAEFVYANVLAAARPRRRSLSRQHVR